MAADSSTSAQRRRATKPLIEKRRRARINSSLAQLKEIVAKPSGKAQEPRASRLEKADILEMTVDYVKRLHERDTTVADDPQKDVAIATNFEKSFKDGYKLCMSEVQNFFFRNYQKQASEEFLSNSLQNYLLQVYRKSLTSQERLSLSETLIPAKASSSPCKNYSKINNDFRTPRDNMNDSYEFNSENSDLGLNYSCGSTDDEMTESYCIADSKDNREVIESYLLINGISPMKDISCNGDNDMNPNDRVWRPW